MLPYMEVNGIRIAIQAIHLVLAYEFRRLFKAKIRLDTYHQ